MNRRSEWLPVLALSLLVAACGAAPASPATGGVASEAAPAAATPSAAASAEAPVDASAPAPAAGGSAACDLLTPAEVEAATDQSSVEAQPVAAGDTEGTSACGFVASNVPLAIVTVLDPANTNVDPATYKALPGSEDIAVGGGATAIWAPGAGQVAFVLKGGTVVAIQVLAGPDGDFKAAAASLAGSLANHLP